MEMLCGNLMALLGGCDLDKMSSQLSAPCDTRYRVTIILETVGIHEIRLRATLVKGHFVSHSESKLFQEQEVEGWPSSSWQDLPRADNLAEKVKAKAASKFTLDRTIGPVAICTRRGQA